MRDRIVTDGGRKVKQPSQMKQENHWPELSTRTRQSIGREVDVAIAQLAIGVKQYAREANTPLTTVKKIIKGNFKSLDRRSLDSILARLGGCKRFGL